MAETDDSSDERSMMARYRNYEHAYSIEPNIKAIESAQKRFSQLLSGHFAYGEDLRNLSQEIQEHYLANRQTAGDYENKMSAMYELGHIIRKHRRWKFKLFPSGSTMTGLASKGSDLDLTVWIPHARKYYANESEAAFDILRNIRHFLFTDNEINYKLESVLYVEAKVPVLKIKWKKGLETDLSCSTEMFVSGIQNSYLIRGFALWDKRFAPLCMLVKDWASRCDVKNPKHGGFNRDGRDGSQKVSDAIAVFIRDPIDDHNPGRTVRDVEYLQHIMSRFWATNMLLYPINRSSDTFPILLLFCTVVHLQARSNRSRLRSLLYRIDKLMSPLKRQARAATTFRAPLNGKCGLSEEVRVCRPKCEPTCGDRNPTCSATCGEAVCMCQRGSVRQSGMCIPVSACRFFDFEVETKTNVNKLPTKPQTVRAPLAKAVSPKAVTSATATVLHHPPTSDSEDFQLKHNTVDISIKDDAVGIRCQSDALRELRKPDGWRPITNAAVTSPGAQTQWVDLSRRRGPIGPVGPTTNRVPPKNIRVPIPPSRSPNRSPPSIVPNRPLNRSPSPTLPKKTPSSMNAGPVPPTTLPPKPRYHIPRPPSAVPPNFGPPGVSPHFMFRQQRVKRNALLRRRQRLRRSRAI
ncbi:unnamed protein product [Haemonchus placei]|uniref:TIL domain-containing protein n=1 Tax=Haemonchus placei TaxID=6290 RepID=A0A158QNK8_HAEPC|nr:unnamed protein product [Haemonchus placei]